MNESRLNIQLFKKIRDRIAAIPESYDQCEWWRPSDDAPCGTAACLAGEAVICAASTVEEGIAELKKLVQKDRYYAVPDRAIHLLGLNGNWAAFIDEEDVEGAGEAVIFDGGADYWPLRFRRMFRDEGEAEAAVAYLDHIIETGKVLE